MVIEHKFPLSSSLVPIVTADELEKYAEAIVKDAMPNALEMASAVNVEELVEIYLGLNVEYKRLSHDERILGMTAFNDGFIHVVNPETLEKDLLCVNKGTILIEIALLEKCSVPRFRFTIMHEGSHWLLHKKAFSADNVNFIKQDYLSGIATKQNYENGQPRVLETDSDFLEWQADFLASAILMPRPSMKIAITDYMNFYKLKPKKIIVGKDSFLDEISKGMPDYIAKVFNVSKQAANIRLRKLGVIVENKNDREEHYC